VRHIWQDEQLDSDEPLWRYFTPERLLETFRTSELHFASARQFEDRFEGAVAVQPHDWPVDPRYGDLEDSERAFEQLRRLTKISCWHRADYESDAMWKLYAGQRKGLAIRTSVQRLGAALHPFRLAAHFGEEEPYWGKVRYVDLRNVRLRASMESRFFYKHRAFEWEREFRVAISLRMAEENAVEVPEEGIRVRIDPHVLVEELYLGPSLTSDERAAIVSQCDEIEVPVTPIVSTLLGRPRYT
jgi:hypothetical protein